MNKRTPGQDARERELRALKKQVLEEMFASRGYALCECGDCAIVYQDLERAMAELDAHHIQLRGMGRSYKRAGIDDRPNIKLLRRSCHRRAHEKGRVEYGR